LGHTATPAAVLICLDPTSSARGFIKAKVFPGMRSFRVLKDAAKDTNGKEGRFKTAVIIA
jgi:hypothetical protein